MKRRMIRRWALGALVIFASSVGCNSAGCDILQPMPNDNEVPKSQTIEGGLQVRITPGGFQKISDLVPGLVEGFGDMTAIGASGGTLLDIAGIDVITYGLCQPAGCNLSISIPPGGVDITVQDPYMLIDVDVNFNLPIRFDLDIVGFSVFDGCTLNIGANDVNEPLNASLGIEPYIRDTDGELRIRVQEINNLSFSGVTFNFANCGWATDVLNYLSDYVNDFIGIVNSLLNNPITNFIVNALLPYMQDLIDGMVPDPLGLEGQFDVGSLLAGFSPGAEGILELRMVPGGDVGMLQNGMSLNVITGVNSDYDPTTRGEGLVNPLYGVKLHSENHPKMPPMTTVDLNTLNGGLTKHADYDTPGYRRSFVKPFVTELNGVNDNQYLTYLGADNTGKTADLAFGITEDFLDLIGFHLLNSGALCLEIGTSEVDMLSVGLFSILVSSLEDLVDPEVGDAPMRLVVRPQMPMDFTVYDPFNTAQGKPLMEIDLKDFQVDVYAFAEGRYVRAFTMALDLTLGLNLTSRTDRAYSGSDPNVPADCATFDPNNPNDPCHCHMPYTTCTVYVVPEIGDIESENVTVRIQNSELISSPPAELETLFPSVLSMLMPMLTGALPEIALPEVLGFGMETLEFRAGNANATPDTVLVLATMQQWSDAALPPPPLPGNQPPPPPPAGERFAPIRTQAEVASVHVPTPAALRASLLDRRVPKADKDVPEVRIDVTADNAPADRDVEWQYRLNGGAWRMFQTGPELVIRDETFFFQGYHRIELRGRVKGNAGSLEVRPVALTVLIDSVAPRHKAKVEGDQLYFGGFDYVTARGDLEYAYELEPGRYSEWAKRGSVRLGYAQALAKANGGVLRYRVRDEAGNVANAEVGAGLLAVNPVMPKAGGCGCQTDSGASGFGLLVLGLLGLLGWRRRRPFDRKLVTLTLLVGAMALVAVGCAKKSPGTPADAGLPPCEDDTDCAALQCPDGEIAQCVFGACECRDDLVWGKTGPHSSHAESYDSIMVAAYNQRYGDLMYTSIRKGDIGSNPVLDENDWVFVDGVPWDEEPDVPTSDIRGGIKDKGDNVGRFTSIGADSGGNPVIAYYDLTHGALKLARKDGENWRIMLVDDGGSSEEPELGDAGRYTSMSMRSGSDYAPGVAYFTQYLPGSDEFHMRTELRFAEALTGSPAGPADFMIYVVDSAEIEVPVDEEGAPLAPDKWPLGDWPSGVGVTCSVTRTSDGRPVVVYYDSLNGNLKAAEFNGTAFDEPVILDGEDDQGADTGNVGLFPSVKISPTNDSVWHVSYMDVGLRQLVYQVADTGEASQIETVDHGLRMETNDITGLPMPVSHMVGFDSKIVLAGNKVFIAYQDGTNHELRWAERNPSDPHLWSHRAIAGDTPPVLNADGDYEYEGAFGFYIGLTNDESNVAYLSTYAINEWAVSNLAGDAPVNYWVQIFAVQLGEG